MLVFELLLVQSLQQFRDVFDGLLTLLVGVRTHPHRHGHEYERRGHGERRTADGRDAGRRTGSTGCARCRRLTDRHVRRLGDDAAHGIHERTTDATGHRLRRHLADHALTDLGCDLRRNHDAIQVLARGGRRGRSGGVPCCLRDELRQMLCQGTHSVERDASAAVELVGKRMHLQSGDRLVGQGGQHTAQLTQALGCHRPVPDHGGHPDVTGRERPHRNSCRLAVVNHRLPLRSLNSLRLAYG
ncbi:hypothetical protein SGRI78S_02356 [Streptomyces griseus subsp. griseus]